MAGVLGLDLAKLTGVAWIGERIPGPRPCRPWHTWTIELNPRGGIQGQHYFLFQKQLDEALREWKPRLVVFEQVQFIGGGTARKGGLLAYRINAILCGLVMVRCESFAIPYLPVGVPTLKAFARRGLGTPENGRPSKEDMAGFARVKLFDGGELSGPYPEEATTDEVDALWTAWYGTQHLAAAAA